MFNKMFDLLPNKKIIDIFLTWVVSIINFGIVSAGFYLFESLIKSPISMLICFIIFIIIGFIISSFIIYCFSIIIFFCYTHKDQNKITLHFFIKSNILRMLINEEKEDISKIFDFWLTGDFSEKDFEAITAYMDILPDEMELQTKVNLIADKIKPRIRYAIKFTEDGRINIMDFKK